MMRNVNSVAYVIINKPFRIKHLLNVVDVLQCNKNSFFFVARTQNLCKYMH